MLAPNKPTPTAIEGQEHFVPCPDCNGECGSLGYACCGGQGCGADGMACWRDCDTCTGRGFNFLPVNAEECACEQCTFGYWVWCGDEPAVRFALSADARLYAEQRPGADITQRRRLAPGVYKHQSVQWF